MRHETVLQTFAVNKDGVPVHVEDVPRGAACECHCAACGQALIARQGDERAWHFAHVSGADCPGALESALHLAAKIAVQGAHGIMLPPMTVEGIYQLTPAWTFTADTSREYGWIDFDQIELEPALGPIRPDLLGHQGSARWIVEVCVTHPVAPEKAEWICSAGIPAIEVHLDAFARTGWSWPELEAAVVDSTDHKTWLFCPDEAALRSEAEARARAQAAPFEYARSVEAAPIRHRFVIHGMIVDVTERGFGYCMWSSWHPGVTPMIAGIAKRLGGRWKPRFRNWLVPTPLGPELLRQLRNVADGTSGASDPD